MDENKLEEWHAARYEGKWGNDIDSPIPSAIRAQRIHNAWFDIGYFNREIWAAELALHRLCGYEKHWHTFAECGIPAGTSNRLAQIGIFWIEQLFGVDDFAEFKNVRGIGKTGATRLEATVNEWCNKESETDDNVTVIYEPIA